MKEEAEVIRGRELSLFGLPQQSAATASGLTQAGLSRQIAFPEKEEEECADHDTTEDDTYEKKLRSSPVI